MIDTLTALADELDTFVKDLMDDGNDQTAQWLEYRVKRIRRLDAQPLNRGAVRAAIEKFVAIQLVQDAPCGMRVIGVDLAVNEILSLTTGAGQTREFRAPLDVSGTCEDPRLAAAGCYVCCSRGGKEWHWHGPDRIWHDDYTSESAAVNAALGADAGRKG